MAWRVKTRQPSHYSEAPGNVKVKFSGQPSRGSARRQVRAAMETRGGFAEAMWCGDPACEAAMKEQAGVTSRCIPARQKKIGACRCVVCGKPADQMVIWGVVY